MSVAWYYVQNNDRLGPVSEDELRKLLVNGPLTKQSYIWRKGFDNWVKASEVAEFVDIFAPQQAEELDIPAVSPMMRNDLDWNSISFTEKMFNIKIGFDRGGVETEYGPFSLEMLKRLYDEKRINAKTFIFCKGMKNWIFLADIPIYESLFAELPPQIEEKERRKNIRKPFIAKLFFHDNTQVFEGICRDISVGGLQVLVAGAPVKIGEAISLNVHPDNSDYHFVAKGKVVRVLDGDQGFSLRFDGLGADAQSAIQTYISHE